MFGRNSLAVTVSLLLAVSILGGTEVSAADEFFGLTRAQLATRLLEVEKQLTQQEALALVDDPAYQAVAQRSTDANGSVAKLREDFTAQEKSDLSYKSAEGTAAQAGSVVQAATDDWRSASAEYGKATSKAQRLIAPAKALRSQLTVAENELAAAQKLYDQIIELINLEVNKSGNNDNALAHVQARIDRARNRVNDLQGKYSEAQSQLDGATAEQAGAKEQMNTRKAALDQANTALHAAKAELDSVHKKLNAAFEQTEPFQQAWQAKTAADQATAAAKETALSPLRQSKAYQSQFQERQRLAAALENAG
ncbi:MAG: hypothetical protein WD042_20135 [Phycisphaeraceae bacterium]